MTRTLLPCNKGGECAHKTFKNLYRHPRVIGVTQEAALQIEFLFEYFLTHTNEIPAHFRIQDLDHPQRRIAHYIAGMTDRFARKEFLRLR